MSSGVLLLMITTSLVLGFIALGALLWGIKTKQFEDSSKFFDAPRFDGEDALNDAVKMEKKRKKALKDREKNYKPEN
ncbi:MAG: cbb3-type cytochrome oxidase assembly protein CcoS [Campylobacter sp.]|nr:cbb3-type cytochrome oxidase assembly protein CcoS [Campylobacter sp.]